MDYKLTYYKRQDVEEFKKTVNQSAINNINEFMTNPISQMINIINENNLTISQYLAQNNVESLAKALKLTNLDTLKVNFTSDINENASYNPLTNEITLNTRNEGNYIPIIAHEMVGHAILGEVIQSDNVKAIYEHIAKNILSEQELANIRNNYTELDESGFKEEVVSFGLEKIMNNTNNLSYKKFVRKFFPSSFKDKVMNSLDTIFRNNSDNRVLNEIRKTIRQVLDENITNTNNQELAVKYAKDITSNEEQADSKRNILTARLKNDKQNTVASINDQSFLNYLNEIKNYHSKEKITGLFVFDNFDYEKLNKFIDTNNLDFDKPLAIKKEHLYKILNDKGIIKEGINDHYHNVSISTFNDFIKNNLEIIEILKQNNKYIYLFNTYNSDNNQLLAVFDYTKNNQNNILSLYYKNKKEYFYENKEFLYKKRAPSSTNQEGDVSSNILNLEENNSDVNNENLTPVKDDTKKYSKSNVLELSKKEVRDLANKKQGEVISYKSATDFINSFNSIGEVLENRLGIKLNRNDTAINDLFNDTNIQNSEVAVDNLFKNTLVDYNDTQISLDTYLKNLGFKTNDLKSYLI